MLKTGIKGEGTYGIIYSAKSSETDEEYGVKRNLIDPKISFAGSVRELDLLAKCQSHPHLISISHISIGSPFSSGCFSPLRKRDSCKDDKLHFIFPLAECDLDELIGRRDITFASCKRYLAEILLGLEYLHAKKIMHRDLKPENILYDGKTLQICDFGLGKPYIKAVRQSPFVVTASHRAPELLCDWENYDYKIDIWSFACVAIELLSYRPFIRCRKDNNRIILDSITQNMPTKVPDKLLNSMLSRSYIRRFKQKDIAKRESLYSKLFSHNHLEVEEAEKEACVDMLSHALVFHPKDRWLATDLLNHSFLDSEREIIDNVRREHPPIEDSLPKVECVFCNERSWAFDLMCDYFNDRYEHEWYTHNILFLSMDIYDRYLLYLSKGGKEKKETHCQGKYLTKFNAEVHYFSCLYLAIKYFSVETVSFREIIPKNFRKDRVYKIAEDLDLRLIRDILRYQIFRPNIYTMSESELTDIEAADMVMLVGGLHKLDPSLDVKEVYEAYRVALRNKEK